MPLSSSDYRAYCKRPKRSPETDEHSFEAVCTTISNSFLRRPSQSCALIVLADTKHIEATKNALETRFDENWHVANGVPDDLRIIVDIVKPDEFDYQLRRLNKSNSKLTKIVFILDNKMNLNYPELNNNDKFKIISLRNEFLEPSSLEKIFNEYLEVIISEKKYIPESERAPLIREIEEAYQKAVKEKKVNQDQPVSKETLYGDPLVGFQAARENHNARFRRTFGCEPQLHTDADYSALDFFHQAYLQNTQLDVSSAGDLREFDMSMYKALQAFRKKHRPDVAVGDLHLINWQAPETRVFKGQADPLGKQQPARPEDRQRPVFGSPTEGFDVYSKAYARRFFEKHQRSPNTSEGEDYTAINFLHEVYADMITDGVLTGAILKTLDQELYDKVGYQLQHARRSNRVPENYGIGDIVSYRAGLTQGVQWPQNRAYEHNGLDSPDTSVQRIETLGKRRAKSQAMG